jgi:predicted  nucleic acid-binding Zn-ribbon protein
LNESAEQDLANLRQEMDENHAKNVEERDSVHQSELEQLNKEIKSLKIELENLKEQHSNEINQLFVRTNNENAESEMRLVSNFSNRLDNLECQKEELESRIKQLEDELKDKSVEIQKIQFENKEKVEKVILFELFLI